ncbi:uncharacterized protein LOC141610878 isoform X1 [Silene latifolia]|uniref:uncharacterized protein LOC141610878 isoform X1 n=1 Tax=Silene latifolia TaxID=37657 RepID=UPI003D7700E5
MRIKVGQKQAAPPSNTYYHPPPFYSHPQYLHANTVYLLRPPRSLSSDRPWIIYPTTNSDGTVTLRHPLSSKPLLCSLPRNFDFSKLHPSGIAVSYQYSGSDKLVVVPSPPFSAGTSVDARQCILLALYDGGKLKGCPPVPAQPPSPPSPWVKLLPSEKLDDIAVSRGYIYAVSRQGRTKLIDYCKASRYVNICKTLIHGSGQFGWRKRLVVDENDLYLVVRLKEKLFQVFMLKWRVKEVYWDAIKEFKGKKVLFMAKDHYFFRRASRKFPGREYKNCIVFHEAAFPQYENDCWVFRQFTKSQGRDQFGVINKFDDEIAVFRLDDRSFAREGENSSFPKIYWSPPAWIFKASSVSVPADEFQCRSASVSSSQLERDENDGEVQSDLKVSNSKDKEKQNEMESDLKVCKDKEKQKEMESEFGNQDQDQEGVESDSDSQDQDDGKMHCDSDGQGKHDGGMHSKTNIEDDTSLQEDTVTLSLSTVEEAATKTLVTMNSGNYAIEQETSGKNITHSVHKASTSSTTEIHKIESTTTKFEGFDIRSDLIPTLQKIWRKHENIIKDSIVRSGDIVARALESLAIMVRILEDNPAQSLSDSQADYLTSTLSDLRNICFKVYWLVPFVEKALKVHRSKPLVESLNNLSQLSSQVKERKTILLDELAKLNDEENKLREEMAKVSKIFYGQVNFDEPIGAGLT